MKPLPVWAMKILELTSVVSSPVLPSPQSTVAPYSLNASGPAGSVNLARIVKPVEPPSVALIAGPAVALTGTSATVTGRVLLLPLVSGAGEVVVTLAVLLIATSSATGTTTVPVTLPPA